MTSAAGSSRKHSDTGGRRADPLYGIRRLLRRRADRLSPHAWARLLTSLGLGDRDAQIATS